jgi:hypothetical protein
MQALNGFHRGTAIGHSADNLHVPGIADDVPQQLANRRRIIHY